MSAPKPTLAPPVAIPDHGLIRPIGRGSYGEVWLARTVLGEYRAVKIICRDAFDRDRPLERELEGIQKFEPISRSHENQVHILHVGQFAEGFYYVMELADDGSEFQLSEPAEAAASEPDRLEAGLQTYVPRTLRSEVRRRGRLPVAECVELALKLTDALAHLHEHGLVHRDVKPSNIIFVRRQPKLADIGLVASSDASLSCVGTEGFLPPEGPGKPQADIYALGKVLYEISTGRDRNDFPELPTLLRDDPQRRALEEFNEVILKSCDHDVRRRYSTARAMHADLELLSAGRSLQQARRRERRWAGARKFAVAAALVGGVLALISTFSTRSPEPVRTLPLRLDVDGMEFMPAPFIARKFDFSPDGERLIFARGYRLYLWERTTSISRVLELGGPYRWKTAEGNDASQTTQDPATKGRRWMTAGGRGALAMPRWAPDSRHLVFQALRVIGDSPGNPIREYGLFLVNADTGDARQIGPDLPEADKAVDLCWRSDGQGITYVFRGNQLATLSLSGERSTWNNADLQREGVVRLGDYSSDGAWLLVSAETNGKGTVARDIWAMRHLGSASTRLTHRAGLDAYPTWGPDRAVYYVSDEKGSKTWGLWKLRVDDKTMLPTGPSTEVIVRNGSQLLHPKFVAAGRRLVYAVVEPKTDVWVSDSDALEKRTTAVSGLDPVLSPEGQTIYFLGERPHQQGIFAIGRNGDKETFRKVTDLTPLTGGGPNSGLSISSDGKLLAFFGYNGKKHGVFTIPAHGGEPRLVEALPAGSRTIPVWSPDGQWLAYTADKRLVRTSRDGRVRELLDTPLLDDDSIRWSPPDGRYLAAFANATTNETYEMRGIYVLSVADKTWKNLTPGSEHKEKDGLQWHPKGEYLTYMLYGPTELRAQIRRAYLDGRPTDLMIEQPDHWDYLGVWAPDSQRFFFVSTEDNEQSVHIYDAATTQITHRVWKGGIASLPRWSHDRRTAVWSIADSRRYFEVIENFR